MTHNIVIAGRSDNVTTLNNIASSLKSSARLSYAGEPPLVTVVADIESVSDYVGDGDVTTLIISETISSIEKGTDATISKANIAEWKEQYPNMLVVLLVETNRKGGVKLAKLFESGYFNALFYSDFKTNAVIDLIQSKGRNETTAQKYYGLEDSGSVTMRESAVREPSFEKDESEPDEERRRPTTHTKKRKSSLIVAPSMQDDFEGEDGDDEEYEEKPRRVEKKKLAPSPKHKKRYEEDEYEEEYEDDEDDYDEEDDEYYEEEEEPEPPRRKRHVKRPRKQHIYPMPETSKLYFGKVEDVEDDMLYVKVSLKDRTVLDESFIGSDVFFIVSTEEP